MKSNLLYLFMVFLFHSVPVSAQTVYWAGADIPYLCIPWVDGYGHIVNDHADKRFTDVEYNARHSRLKEVDVSDWYGVFTSEERIPLSEVPSRYCPGLEGRKVLFMIDKFFITDHVERYTIDPAYIYKVELLPSEKLYPLKQLIKKPFTIVRIFTKTPYNWHPLDSSVAIPDTLYPVYGKMKINHQLEYLSDVAFNDLSSGVWCYTYNGEYLGPRGMLGINLEKVVRKPVEYPFTIKGLGMTLDADWQLHPERYTAYGKPLLGVTDFTSGKRQMNLISLAEVRDQYCSHVKDKTVLYTINKFFITRDPLRYKIDKDFIFKVETLHARDIPELKGYVRPQFTVIRIFTRTLHNWHGNEVN